MCRNISSYTLNTVKFKKAWGKFVQAVRETRETSDVSLMF